MSKLIMQLKMLSIISDNETKLRTKGFWPGAETTTFRLWWNDEDECIIEERKKGKR